MSISEFESRSNDDLPSLDYSTYASSPKSIQSEESVSSTSSISDEVQFSEHLLGKIVKVDKDEDETQDSSSSKKRLRTTFTDLQLICLEKIFEEEEFLNRPKRLLTAKKLGLDERQVKVWFQNRRMKGFKPRKKGRHGNKGKKKSSSDKNDIKKKKNSLIAEKDVKFRVTNGSAGYGSTAHRHLPQNVELNTKTYDSYSNASSCETSSIGSQENENMSYTESYDYGDSDTDAYDSNSYHYPTSSAINNIHDNGYYSQSDDKYASYDYDNYYTTNEITASDLNLYTTRKSPTSEQSCNSSTKSELFDSSDDITNF